MIPTLENTLLRRRETRCAKSCWLLLLPNSAKCKQKGDPMAIVRQLRHQPLEHDAPHTEAECTYCIVTDANGVRYFQVDTYGSHNRRILGKKSQSIRFSPEALVQLRGILDQQFAAIPQAGPRRRRVVLTPAAGTEATRHFATTVQQALAVADAEEHLTRAEFAELSATHPDGLFRAWGVTRGSGARNKTKWEQIGSGDLVLFCGHGEAFAYSLVTHKLHSRRLATDLWGTDSDNRTWEYMYFVSEPLTLALAYHRLAALAGYSGNYVVLGFNVLDTDRSARVLDGIDLPLA